MPKVSVIIPVYNQDLFIGQAIDSVFAQTHEDYEIIVVNDGSTDETGQILDRYGNRIRVVNQKNKGLAAARNTGLRFARGEMIGFLDADDLWYPEMLSTTVSHLTKNPDIDLVCGAWDLIDKSGQTIRKANKPSTVRARIRADFLGAIALGNLFPVHAVLVRRNCFECCGFFDTALRAMEDWDLWLRMAAHGHKIDFIDVPIARYRRHDGCMTLDPQRMESSFHKVLSKLFADERNASRLAGLRIHAYIAQWLYLGEYCQEAALAPGLDRCIQMAGKLYDRAPHNEELCQQYLSIALELPRTEYFLKKIAVSTPGLIPSYQWKIVKRFRHNGEDRNALMALLNLVLRHPNWVVQKAFLFIRRHLFHI